MKIGIDVKNFYMLWIQFKGNNMWEILKNIDWVDIIIYSACFWLGVLLHDKIFTNKKDKK